MSGKDLEDIIMEMKSQSSITAIERWNTIRVLARLVVYNDE